MGLAIGHRRPVASRSVRLGASDEVVDGSDPSCTVKRRSGEWSLVIVAVLRDHALMRWSRVLLAALLSLGICLQGYAAVRVEVPCPLMQPHASMAGMSAEDTAGVMAHGDCEPGPHTPDHEQSGTSCPDCLSCQLSGASLPSLATVPLIIRAASPKPTDARLLFVTRSLLPLWRPPALI